MKRVLFFLIIFTMFTVVAYTMISENIPVLNYSEASQFTGKFQIKGVPVKGKEQYNQEKKQFEFFLTDEENKEFLVAYSGSKPSNFDQANEIVVVGRLNSDQVIQAERLLVKCPSKYQAEGATGYEIKEYSSN